MGPAEAEAGECLRWVAGTVDGEPRLHSKKLEDGGSARFTAFAWRK